MENIEERENIKDIETQLKMTRSEHSSTSNCKNHEPKVNSEPYLSSSDSSDSSSSDSAPKRKKSKNKKNRRKHRKHDSSDPSLSDDSDDSESSKTVSIDVDDAKKETLKKNIRSGYAQL